MRSIWVWTSDPGWLSQLAYPETHARYSIRSLSPDEPLPSSPAILILDEHLLSDHRAAVERFARRPGGALSPVIAVSPKGGAAEGDELLFDVLPVRPNQGELLRTLRNASHYLENQLRLEESQARAEQKARELGELHEIGIALSAEHDHHRLLSLILGKAREITNADAGSLFLVASLDMPIETPERTVERVGGRWLRFRLAQNDSRALRFEEDILAIGPGSIAGYVAETGETLNLEDAYTPSPEKPFAINRSFDETISYRTRSMLTIPMQNHEGECIGVLQLINKKRRRDTVLEGPSSFDSEVLPFDEHDERLVRSLASQAAVSIENNNLYLQRENLFARFVDAAVQAIESRDPTTQGHSRRVAEMTAELARVVNVTTRGPYGPLHISDEQIRELRYAALLHDFGKVGVKEKVLRKATKLYHGELNIVRQRFKTIRRTLESRYYRCMLDRLLSKGATHEDIEALERELTRELELVERARSAVEEANKPTVTHYSAFEFIEQLGSVTYDDLDGSTKSYLEPEEIVSLTVARGTLTEPERRQIESHVNHTYDFLSTIPWTRDLQDIPELARSHHEKLDGSGYPAGLTAADIPPQTRMMTISDIFDALTAKDRPYKPAVPTAKALAILEEDAGKERIDRHLLDLFIEARVYLRGISS
ncbi:MAG TPA: HD domain-containing phosphohydrolase [Vicinamibacteria bacterium]